MTTVIIRAIIIYTLVLIIFRLMGKRQIGEMQPFELVLTLTIADLATIPMGDLSIPILHGIVPLFTLSLVHFILVYFSKKSHSLSKIISGKPIIIINPNGLDWESLNLLKLSPDDVFGAIRSKGYFKLEQIEYAIMETNGQINVLPKADYAPVTNKDLKIKAETEGIPITIVSEGSILQENLKLAKVEESFVDKILKKAKIKSLKDCLILTMDELGTIYIQEKGKKYQILEVKDV